jgi:hypothetical protein
VLGLLAVWLVLLVIGLTAGEAACFMDDDL